MISGNEIRDLPIFLKYSYYLYPYLAKCTIIDYKLMFLINFSIQFAILSGLQVFVIKELCILLISTIIKLTNYVRIYL
jgi:hypothetical protein